MTMSVLGFLLEKVFVGQYIKRYLNSLKLREALENLRTKYSIEVWTYPGNGACIQSYDSSKNIDGFTDITIEVYLQEKIRRIHIDYKSSYGHNRVREHYGNDSLGTYFEYVRLTHLFLLNQKKVTDFESYFLEICRNLEERQTHLTMND